MAAEEDATLVHVLDHGVSHALGLYASDDAWNDDPDWARLDERAPTGLRATLGAIGRGLNALLATPRYATLRRGAAPADVNAYAEVDDEGTLTLDAVFGPGALEARRARLELLDPAGGSVVLESAPVERRMARFVLPGFGLALGIEAGSLPGSLFRISTEVETPAATPPGFLLAEEGTEGLVVLVTSPPVWEGGVLSLGLGLTPALRERPDDFLELFVRTGSVDVRLHACPLSDLGEDGKTIRVHAQGRDGAKNLCGSLLRVRILPAESSKRSKTC